MWQIKAIPTLFLCTKLNRHKGGRIHGILQGIIADEIRDRLNSKYGWIGSQLGNHLGIVNAFVHTMEKDDLVLVKENDWVHIGRVNSYKYDSHFESDGMCHRREVRWLAKVKRDALNAEIRELLGNRRNTFSNR